MRVDAVDYEIECQDAFNAITNEMMKGAYEVESSPDGSIASDVFEDVWTKKATSSVPELDA